MTEAQQKIVAPTVTVENVHLEAFETLVYSRRHEEAGRELLRILKRLKVGGEFAGHPTHEGARLRLYTRLASAITALLADPQFQLSQEGFDLLAVEHATFSAVFQASAFGNADHLLRQFGVPDEGDPNKLHFSSPQTIVKLLLAYSLDSELELDFENIFRAAPRLALPAFLGMLANIVVLSPEAHRRREKLLTLGPLFEQVELGEHMLAAVSDAYMYCSYATAESKHEIKRSFNKMMRRLIEKQIEIPAMPAERRISERPTILVPIEWFTSLHAMYRCYAPSIRQLREKFRLVMIGRSSEMDAISKQLFDEVIEIDAGNVSLADIVGHIRRVAPDIIYYPSLGMATWWVALSTVRLAPIQVMTLGHPATSNSPEIDYVLVTETMPVDPGCFSETVFLISGDLAMVNRDDAVFPEPELRPSPALLRIAVPSMACKLNASFMASCRAIAARSERALEFHFFPNMVGMTWFQIRREIAKWLPNSVVHPRSDYNSYLQNLRNCDIHLSTFPFGGTNSNVDSMRLGLPMVTLEGLEVHSQTDSGMMRSVGVPDWLITYHPSEFERAALRLIGSDAERVAIAERLLETDIEGVFKDRPDSQYSRDFAAAVWNLYARHEEIQRSAVRYWTVADRLAAGRPEATPAALLTP
ncbi:MAG: hypothetical protein IPK29_01960 [Betaproteobacteria bacterium]|nr:hypothetical protein [Betaproteobacteria bacterium]